MSMPKKGIDVMDDLTASFKVANKHCDWGKNVDEKFFLVKKKN